MHKILMVTNLFYPLTGGSEQVVYEVSRRLVERGHEVHVLTEQTKDEWPLYEQVQGIHVHRCRVNYRNGLSRLLSGVRSASRLFETLHQDGAFDLLHFHLTLSSFGVLMNAAAKRTPRIASFYGPWGEEELVESSVSGRFHPGRAKASLFDALQKYVLRHSNRIVVLSRYSESSLADLFGDAVTCDLIPGAADIQRFRPADDRSAVRQRLGLPPSSDILLTVRRLVPRMGIDVLINAMPTILESNKDTRLVIGGTGPIRTELEDLVTSIGVADHVFFAGYIPDEELPLYYQAADLFVLPTRALEGFGLTTVEALACGTPVAGTSVGATAEILTDLDERFLIPDSTPAAIAATVLACLNTVRDVTFRQECRAYAERRYDWERVVDQLERVYSDETVVS